MQAGTVSRLRFCKRSWGFKIHFWRNIVRFRKSYIFPLVGCVRNRPQFLTVQQNPKSSLWTLDWDYSGFLLSSCGIWLFLFWETRFRLLKNRWDPLSKTKVKNEKSHGMIDDLDNVDFISSNVNSSRQEVLLYVFEDNEAVIKMIIKWRSPTMRHVSRTTELLLVVR